MKLETAINRLTQIERFSNYPFMPGDQYALRIAIEAMKRIDHCHRWTSSTWGSPLPGETEE